MLICLLLQGFEPYRENVVFLIDAQPAMFEETDLANSPVSPTCTKLLQHGHRPSLESRNDHVSRQDFAGDSWFDAAIKTTREMLKTRIIASDNDQMAVVFYGTVCIWPQTCVSATSQACAQHCCCCCCCFSWVT